MFNRFRRKHGDDKPPKGIGGIPPFPSQGPITALRVLGRNYAVDLDPEREGHIVGRDGPPHADIRLPLPMISRKHALITRSGHQIIVTDLGSKNGIGTPYHGSLHRYVRTERIEVSVGDRFSMADVRLLALDEPTHQLTKPLGAYCGHERDDDLDSGLEAVAVGHVLLLHGARLEPLRELARTLHDGSIRRDLPFTEVHSAPESDDEIDELCTAAGCGTVFLDMTIPFVLPPRFARHLLGGHSHLWTIVATAAPTPEEVIACFGRVTTEDARPGLGFCALGFPARARGLTWLPRFIEED